ncbi:MAG: CapA family protein [Clostridiales bacterium]|nr:CapA family protein [Clostridiales bacterium]
MNELKSHHIVTAVCIAAILIMTPMSCAHKKGTTEAEPMQQPSAQATEMAEAAAPERSLSVTAAGDCTFARDESFARETSFDAYAEKYGADYFFENVRDIFAEDDLTIINFEGTMSTQGAREAKQFAFRGNPSYVNILTGSSVEAANLANNHSADYGAISLTDTKMYLDQAGILNCRGEENVSVSEINGIKVGLVGINYLNDQMKTELEAAISKAKSMGAELVILSIHWGVEKAAAPNDEQIEAAHRAIDCGADLVIGTHPHVLEGVEKYNGKYIWYSLGNFCFGGNSNPSDKDSAIFRIKFTFNGNELIDDDNYEIIPCRISESDGYNDYQPTPAQGDAKARIEARLTEYSQALGTSDLKFR